MSSFSEFQLSAPVLRAIEAIGFETPSPIQAQALPILLGEPCDFLGLAGTGTGKTAAFAIPLLERIDPKVKGVQGLVLCPTRELAMQVAGQIDLLGKFMGVRTVTVYGGAGYADQIHGLSRGAPIVVGTPGRVVDHLKRGTLVLDRVQTLVLDEADEMFSMGFKDELDQVLSGVAKDTSKTWLFSATMSPEVRRIAQNNLRQPKTVQVNRTAMLSEGVEQFYYRCQESEKPEMICRLIEGADDFYGLVFCQTKALVADLTDHLVERGFRADCLHGDKDQTSRERTMQAFRDRKVQILVCTDVAARGLDVKDVTHVVNYSLPREMESYVHRIGRTARSGKTGIVMNLLTFSHRHLLGRIEAHTKVRMNEGVVPSRREIGAKKVTRLLSRFADQPFHERVLEVMSDEWKEKLATLSSEEVAAHFIAMMMPDVFGEAGGKRRAREERRAAAPAAAPLAPRPMPTAKPAATLEAEEVESAPERREERPARAERPMRGPRPAPPPTSQPQAESRPSRDEIDDILNAEPSFGVRPAKRSFEERPEREARSPFGDRRARPERGPRPPFGDRRGASDRSERGPRPPFCQRTERSERGPRPPFGERRADRGAGGNLPPSRKRGLATEELLGEGAGMNRRARRAAKFGQPTN